MLHRMAALGGVIVLAVVSEAATTGLNLGLPGDLPAPIPAAAPLESVDSSHARVFGASFAIEPAAFPAPSDVLQSDATPALLGLTDGLGGSNSGTGGVGGGGGVGIPTPGAAALALIGGVVAVRRRR